MASDFERLRRAVSAWGRANDRAHRRLQQLQRQPSQSQHTKLAEAQREYLRTAGAYNDALAALDRYKRTGIA